MPAAVTSPEGLYIARELVRDMRHQIEPKIAEDLYTRLVGDRSAIPNDRTLAIQHFVSDDARELLEPYFPSMRTLLPGLRIYSVDGASRIRWSFRCRQLL